MSAFIDRLRAHRLAIAGCALVALSCTALAAALDAPPVKPAAQPEPPPTRYSMRCWQYGRLLFDETLAQLPAEKDAVTLKLQGADRAHSTYHLVDTRTAVCLVKPATDRGAWPAVPPGGVPGR